MSPHPFPGLALVEVVVDVDVVVLVVVDVEVLVEVDVLVDVEVLEEVDVLVDVDVLVVEVEVELVDVDDEPVVDVDDVEYWYSSA